MNELDCKSLIQCKERISPTESERVYFLRHEDCMGKTVYELLPEDLVNSDVVVQITLNNVELNDEQLHTTYVAPGDELIYRVVPTIPGLTTVVVVKFIILTAIGIGLNFLIQAIIGSPRKPRSGKDSPHYSFDTPENTTRNGTPIMLCYGEVRVAGHVLQAKTVINSEGKTELFILLALGEGGERGWQDILGFTQDVDDQVAPNTLFVNGTPASSYSGLTVSVRLGTKHQAIIPGFEDTVVLSTPYEIVVPQATPFLYTTINDVHEIEFKLNFTRGLFRSSKSGLDNKSVSYLVRYRQVGTVIWFGTTTKTLTERTSSPFKISYRIQNLALAKYEVEVQRVSADPPGTDGGVFEISEFNEIINDDIAYVGKALLGIKAIATDQLHGTPPSFTALCKALKVRVYTTLTSYTYQWSQNMSWILLDLLINPRSALSRVINISEINAQSFIDYGAYCSIQVPNENITSSEDRIQCDIIIDQVRPAWDWVYDLAITGNASMFRTSGTYEVKANAVLSPVMMFNGGNCNNLKVGYTPIKERVNYVESHFFDKILDFRENVITAIDPAVTDTATYIKESVEYIGVSRRSQALRLSNQRINAGKLSKRYASWDTDIFTMRVTPSDMVEVADENVLWGLYSGRVKSGAATAVFTDREIVIEAGKLYYVRVWHTIPGTFEERTLLNNSGITTIVATTGAFNTTPVAGDFYTIGEVNQLMRQMQITDITQKDDFTYSIFALEYSPLIFSDAIVALPEQIVSVGFDARLPPPDVTNLSATERVIQLQDGSLEFALDVSWTPPASPILAGYLVWIRTLGSSTFPQSPRTSAVKGNYVRVDGDLLRNETYEVTVTPVSIFGVRKSPEVTPRVSLKILGSTTRPPDVTGYQVSRVGDTLVHSWNSVLETSTVYEIRTGANWDSGVVVVTDWTSVSYETSLFFADTVTAFTQTFLIKAKNSSGIYSLNATSVAISIDPKLDANLILTRNEQVLASIGINDATNATPIVITTAGNHGYSNGDVITVYGVLGNTAANGRRTIAGVTSTTFQLSGSVGNGAYIAGAGDFAIKSWNGVRVNMDVGSIGPTEYLQLNDSTSPYSGTYETPEIDLGATYRTIVTTLAQVTQIDTTMTWANATFTWGSAEAQNRTWGGPVNQNNLTLLIEAKYGTSTPISASYEEFIPTERSIRYARFKVTLGTTDNKFTGRLSSFKMMFDVPDILDGDEGVSVTGSLDVVYNKPFTVASSISLQVTARDLGNGERIEIPAAQRSATGFRVRILDTLGMPLGSARIVDWFARGY